MKGRRAPLQAGAGRGKGQDTARLCPGVQRGRVSPETWAMLRSAAEAEGTKQMAAKGLGDEKVEPEKAEPNVKRL